MQRESPTSRRARWGLPNRVWEGYGTVIVAFSLYLALLAFLVSRQRYEVPLPQFLLGEWDLVNGHRIASEFLPVGYPIVLAIAHFVGHTSGERGVESATTAINIGLIVVALLGLYRWLSRVTSRGYALVVVLAIGVYPELIRNLTKVSDTNLTTCLLIATLLALGSLRRLANAVSASVFGIVLGAAVLVRPNLCLLLVLAALATKGLPWKRQARLLILVLATSVFAYVAVTWTVHGEPFWPKNGPYNFFAGANEFSERALLDYHNAEVSILPALQRRGLHPGLSWHRPPDQPDVDDSRDLRYAPIYRAAAWQYIRQHPGQMVRLTLVKLFTFLRPDIAPGLPAPWTSVWLALKTSVRLGAVFWLIVCIFDRCRGGAGPLTAIGLLALLYVVPFLVTNADPRFRTPLDIVLLADAARMLYWQWNAEDRSLYFTSSPRPAA